MNQSITEEFLQKVAIEPVRKFFSLSYEKRTTFEVFFSPLMLI